MHYQEAINRYITYVQDTKLLATATVEAYSIDLKKLSRYIKHHAATNEIELIQKEVFEGFYRQELGRWQPRTVKRIRCSVLTFLQFLLDFEIINKFPFRPKLFFVRLPQQLPKEAEETSVSMVFEYLQECLRSPYVKRKGHLLRDMVILALLAATGARISEVLALRSEDVRFNGDHLIIKVLGKGSRERIIPVAHTEIINLLVWYVKYRPKTHRSLLFANRSGKKCTPQCFRINTRKYCNVLGVKPFKPHQVRHLFGTRLINEGAEIFNVMKLMGHSQVLTTQMYIGNVSKSITRTVKEFRPAGYLYNRDGEPEC